MEQNNHKKNAVFVSAGKESLHRQLLKGDADFDLHLLIYDDSYDLFCHDTEFISVQSGYKMDMTYRYLKCHPEFLENYEYFFLMDDDIEMGTEEVNKLFGMMRKYNLKIAQPSLVMSYCSYEHTLHHPLCVLRYTNFVEMMIPCFSREALLQVLPTFEVKTRWRGIEFHWPFLINSNKLDMAIIDLVEARHVNPIKTWNEENRQLMKSYLAANHLSPDVFVFTSILAVNIDKDMKEKYDAQLQKLTLLVYNMLNESMLGINLELMPPFILALRLYAEISNKRDILDVAERAMEELCGTPVKLCKLIDFSYTKKSFWKALKTQLQIDRQTLDVFFQELKKENSSMSSKIFDCIHFGYEIITSTRVN